MTHSTLEVVVHLFFFSMSTILFVLPSTCHTSGFGKDKKLLFARIDTYSRLISTDSYLSLLSTQVV